MKDALGHGSDARGGVSSQATAVKALVNMIRQPAAHQAGVEAATKGWQSPEDRLLGPARQWWSNFKFGKGGTNIQ